MTFYIPHFLQEEKQTAGRKKATDLLEARSSCDVCLLTRCGPELRRYTEKPGGIGGRLFSLVMFFSLLGPSTVARCARLSSSKVGIRNVSQLPLEILLHIVTNSNSQTLSFSWLPVCLWINSIAFRYRSSGFKKRCEVWFVYPIPCVPM